MNNTKELKGEKEEEEFEEEIEDEEGNIIRKKPTTDSSSTNTSSSNTTGAPQQQGENKVFLYSGKWAYKGQDGQLYIHNTTTNQWERETKVTNDMIRQQQSAYGGSSSNPPSNRQQKDNKRKNNNRNKQQPNNKQKQQEEKEQEQKEETIVELIVSGLPKDPSLIKIDDLYQAFRKVGFIQETSEGRPKIQFFIDESGSRTGEAIISFAREESIALAIQILDETEIIPKYKMKLTKATPEQVMMTQPSKNLSSKKNKREDTRAEKKRELNYGWGDSESRVVVIKNLFDPKESWSNPNFFDELKEDLEFGCQRCGEIQSIAIFERNTDGVATIKFKDFEAAEKCVALMDGRYFAQRKLSAEFYDGFTDYHVEETEEERENRLKVWEQYLKDSEEKEEGNKNSDDDHDDHDDGNDHDDH